MSIKNYLENLLYQPKQLLSDFQQINHQQFQTAVKYLFRSKKNHFVSHFALTVWKVRAAFWCLNRNGKKARLWGFLWMFHAVTQQTWIRFPGVVFYIPCWLGVGIWEKCTKQLCRGQSTLFYQYRTRYFNLIHARDPYAHTESCWNQWGFTWALGVHPHVSFCRTRAITWCLWTGKRGSSVMGGKACNIGGHEHGGEQTRRNGGYSPGDMWWVPE